MSHEIDLSKFTVRCDLISEAIYEKENFLNIEKVQYNDINIERIRIGKKEAKLIDKKKGLYTTIYFNDATDSNNRKNLIKAMTIELKKIIKEKNLLGKSSLVVGLGNRLSTPDSLGPKVIDDIVVTRHLFKLNSIDVDDSYSEVSTFIPGVYATTGVESFDSIEAIKNVVKPDFLIIIDALASSSIEKINKTIQITDSGIEPGSGVGNFRKEISEETLGIPVIAIGSPTVVDAATIVNDTLSFLVKKLSFNIMNIDNPKSKLINPYVFDYSNINYKLDETERKMYLGLLGELKEEEIKNLFAEVLTPLGYNLMVTPKEVDFLTDKISFAIAKSINNVLHNINE